MLHGLHGEEIKHLADGASVGILVGSVTGYLPAISAGLTIVWMVLRILETETVKGIIARYRGVK